MEETVPKVVRSTADKDDLLVDIDPQFSAAADSDVQSIGEIPGINSMMKNQEEKVNLNEEESFSYDSSSFKFTFSS